MSCNRLEPLQQQTQPYAQETEPTVTFLFYSVTKMRLNTVRKLDVHLYDCLVSYAYSVANRSHYITNPALRGNVLYF
jgi:hypothetical protein